MLKIQSYKKPSNPKKSRSHQSDGTSRLRAYLRSQKVKEADKKAKESEKRPYCIKNPVSCDCFSQTDSECEKNFIEKILHFSRKSSRKLRGKQYENLDSALENAILDW